MPWGRGWDVASCSVISFHFSIVSCIYLSFPLLTHFLSFLLMSVVNSVRVCWIFMCSSLFPRFSPELGFYNMSVNRNSMCHVQGEALKNQSAFSIPLTQQPWKPHVERTESWGGKNLDSWVSGRRWVPANWHWTWRERETSLHCVEPLRFVGSFVTTASSRLTQLISLSPLLFAKLASW